ncbi:MAG: ATP-binding protein [Azonexus sp.]
MLAVQHTSDTANHPRDHIAKSEKRVILTAEQIPASSKRIETGGSAAAGGFEFQAKLGALFGLQLLAQRPVDHSLGLGGAVPAWIRFESEAPVDDILVATSQDGFIAVQAKTSVDLSPNPKGGLAKTIQQFVRHWLECRDGNGTDLWNRPLDPARDRLVLAVGPSAPSSVRLDLPAALLSLLQPTSITLNRDEAKALDVFNSCVAAAWGATKSEDMPAHLPRQLAELIRVITFDPDGTDSQALDTMAAVVVELPLARPLINTLAVISKRWMTQRGGGDLIQLRQALGAESIALRAPPQFDGDIQKLKAHSLQIGADLESYERIDQADGVIRIARDCQPAALAAAREGSLLLIGEPGAGKSAVINALARELRAYGDVVEMAVDRFSVQNLAGLQYEFNLDHDLVSVLQAWDGPTDGWLVIDALDATRGGKGEGAFRNLIERVLALKGRWKVIASIRTFDLRMGVRFRELFKGDPAHTDYRDSAFLMVRHLVVPSWSPDEFQRVLNQAPRLRRALDGAPVKLQQLAMVPFNTRLIGELLHSGMTADAFVHLASQAGLLRLYWDYRITPLGVGAEACLLRVVQSMVGGRTLRTSTALIAASDPDTLNRLLQQGVLARVENDRYIQFRHHLIFDYAASRLMMDADDIVSGAKEYLRGETVGLMLAPALGFLLHELWSSEDHRERFWTAVERILGNANGDPIFRSVAGRLSAELPETPQDVHAIAVHSASREHVASALWQVVSALAVRVEDAPGVNLAPWAALAGELAVCVHAVPFVLRLLLHVLITTARPPQTGDAVGAAARALMRFALEKPDSRIEASTVISRVVSTYTTNRVESQALLAQVFLPARAATHNWDDVPALCREIATLVEADPDFAAEVYGWSFGGCVTENVTTSMGGSRSQILSLSSNSVQDYGMALYSLTEYYPKFLKFHPEAATCALIAAVEGFIRRQHNSEYQDPFSRTINGVEFQLIADNSHVWAHDPDSSYGHDGKALMVKFLGAFVDLTEAEARAVTEQIARSSKWGFVWSRLFLAAVRRGDSCVDLLWPIAADELWLTQPETRKDAIDLVAKGYAGRTTEERERLESSVESFAMEGFKDPDDARSALMLRLFCVIGQPQLATDQAKAVLDAISAEALGRSQQNERLVRLTSGSWPAEPYFWIRDLDKSLPGNAAAIEALEAAKAVNEAQRGNQVAATDTTGTEQALALLEAVAGSLHAPDLHPALRLNGEGVIGEGCDHLAQGERLVATEQFDPADRFLALLHIASTSANPEVDETTESEYEHSQSWGGPAARIEAATAALNVCLQREDLFPRLVADIDRLMSDPHPATRSQCIGHLVRIWNIDREGFWSRLTFRLRGETNLAVLKSLVGVLQSVIHADTERTEPLVYELMARFVDTPKELEVEDMLSDLFGILHVTYDRAAADAKLTDWMACPADHSSALGTILYTLREAVLLGLKADQPGNDDVRRRSQALMHRIVIAADSQLAAADLSQPLPEEELARLRACAELVDKAVMQLYFATEHATGGSGLDDAACAVFLNEVSPTLELIGRQPNAHTIYQLLQLIELLAPQDPIKAFDLTAHAIRTGGSMGGYQFEALGAELMVRLVSGFLADNKEIFEGEARRQALVDCLEIFMEVGWTSARKLLYRLPELLQ